MKTLRVIKPIRISGQGLYAVGDLIQLPDEQAAIMATHPHLELVDAPKTQADIEETQPAKTEKKPRKDNS